MTLSSSLYLKFKFIISMFYINVKKKINRHKPYLYYSRYIIVLIYPLLSKSFIYVNFIYNGKKKAALQKIGFWVLIFQKCSKKKLQ